MGWGSLNDVWTTVACRSVLLLNCLALRLKLAGTCSNPTLCFGAFTVFSLCSSVIVEVREAFCHGRALFCSCTQCRERAGLTCVSQSLLVARASCRSDVAQHLEPLYVLKRSWIQLLVTCVKAVEAGLLVYVKSFASRQNNDQWLGPVEHGTGNNFVQRANSR